MKKSECNISCVYVLLLELNYNPHIVLSIWPQHFMINNGSYAQLGCTYNLYHLVVNEKQ